MAVPSWVTFTGVDERTSIGGMLVLSARYPIEWGVLFGGRLGASRYPGPATVKNLLRYPQLRLSAHLCGMFSAHVRNGKLPVWPPVRLFNRIQVNAVDPDPETLARLSKATGKPVALQVRRRFPETLPAGVQPLFDPSGGKGKFGAAWPAQPEGIPVVGYAGGLGPENVADALRDVLATNFWIDMESRVRTDDWLDLEKCHAVCTAIWG